MSTNTPGVASRSATGTMSFVRAPPLVTSVQGRLLYIRPRWNTCESASQCVAAWTDMASTSSEYALVLSPAAASEPVSVMTCCGLSRPDPGAWGRSERSSSASDIAVPDLTQAAACSRFSGEMRLSVPRLSSGPHRPQLDTCRASASMRASIADSEVWLRTDLLRRQARTFLKRENAQGSRSPQAHDPQGRP